MKKITVHARRLRIKHKFNYRKTKTMFFLCDLAELIVRS